jgi:hypothetical protein
MALKRSIYTSQDDKLPVGVCATACACWGQIVTSQIVRPESGRVAK